MGMGSRGRWALVTALGVQLWACGTPPPPTTPAPTPPVQEPDPGATPGPGTTRWLQHPRRDQHDLMNGVAVLPGARVVTLETLQVEGAYSNYGQLLSLVLTIRDAAGQAERERVLPV